MARERARSGVTGNQKHVATDALLAVSLSSSVLSDAVDADGSDAAYKNRQHSTVNNPRCSTQPGKQALLSFLYIKSEDLLMTAEVVKFCRENIGFNLLSVCRLNVYLNSKTVITVYTCLRCDIIALHSVSVDLCHTHVLCV